MVFWNVWFCIFKIRLWKQVLGLKIIFEGSLVHLFLEMISDEIWETLHETFDFGRKEVGDHMVNVVGYLEVRIGGFKIIYCLP